MVIYENSLKYGDFSPFKYFKKSFVCDAELPFFWGHKAVKIPKNKH
jgi:hypothetical protein